MAERTGRSWLNSLPELLMIEGSSQFARKEEAQEYDSQFGYDDTTRENTVSEAMEDEGSAVQC